MLSFPAREDLPLLVALNDLERASRGQAQPKRVSPLMGDPSVLFARAEHHSLSGVLSPTITTSLPSVLARQLELRAIARELDHQAHLELLHRIDAAFAAGDAIPAVALKGPLFAERFYRAPSARGTTDVDLMVAMNRLGDAQARLESIGYRVKDARQSEDALRNHHDILFVHPSMIDLELHFRAYRGFGETLPSEPLIARSQPMAGYESIRVLEPADELVYLSVHAAAHRFGRLSWLYDIRLLLESMRADEVFLAASRARASGFGRIVALTGELLAETFGVERRLVEPLGTLSRSRRKLVQSLISEPAAAPLRSATRFIYTAMLCDSPSRVGRYARSATVGYARSRLGL